MCIFHIWNNIFLMFKIKCEKNDFTVGDSKKKIKTLFVYFFKCLFIKRVWSVIFELDEATLSNFVKFRFQRITLKIEQVFGKINNIPSQKLAKMAMKLVIKKAKTNEKKLHGEKIHFWVRLSHYIPLTTSVW